MKNQREYPKNIRDMYNLLGEIKDIKVFEPAVNFILVKLEQSQLSSGELQKRMKNMGYLFGIAVIIQV